MKDYGLRKMEYQLQNERLHDYSVIIMTIKSKQSKTLHYVTKTSGMKYQMTRNQAPKKHRSKGFQLKALALPVITGHLV